MMLSKGMAPETQQVAHALPHLELRLVLPVLSSPEPRL